MEEIKNKAGKKRNVWIWIVIIIILLVLFFAFRGDKGGETGGESADEITALDVGDNPDLGVDDFNSLEVSQEDIVS